MPKLKTHKGIAKRVKLTGTGKLLHRRAYRGHLLAHKQASLKREYVKEFQIAGGDLPNVKKMLGTHNAR
ncbi:MAG TPA: 50S ribosomal protein L35 [Candidatus Saccharimonas sp.]|nr:50S ribosomal protein L35 [Candidatus Saccharimonas sp.]